MPTPLTRTALAWWLVTTVALVAALAWSLVLATPARADEGPWGWPLDAPHEVSRPFEPPAHRYGTGHRGVDLVAAPGREVRAAGNGRVSWSGLLAGRGVVVVVHGALRTTYEPVDERVPAGTVVEVGEVLGMLAAGHLGCPSAACLHWGLRRGDEYLDPLSLVGRGPVRLLPPEGPVARGTALGAPLRSAWAVRSTLARTADGRSGAAGSGSRAGADAERPTALSGGAPRLDASGQAGAQPGGGSGGRPPWPAVGAGALAVAAAGAARGRSA